MLFWKKTSANHNKTARVTMSSPQHVYEIRAAQKRVEFGWSNRLATISLGLWRTSTGGHSSS